MKAREPGKSQFPSAAIIEAMRKLYGADTLVKEILG